ncbi:copper amine oxidase N-terminal domain-containing protein [Tissierella pigra]|uniref:Copper amine oxidase N-terminal domain-containing protein n=1 Tax=Tissierella pigra TaxID=2607614 RepID=A0A6N7XK99_9FIRM|nr:copper amine oxidase N-terminal domain-containing protein [Tissierella pigra]MBU5426214.1 copper amine oxidase N-terminal domain-containing protein [Tissierella pigra]MSU01212.1 copper amine oxidase N-terminal domain-containing protein [Tissierella pigra]
MKKTLKILLTFVLVIGFIAASPKTINASSGIKVLLEGQELKFDVPPQIIEGRTLLPLRAIFEALGLEVGWDDATRIITGVAEGKEIILELDSKEVKVNGVDKTLDVPAKAINGRTLVPVRFIAESLDMNVVWNQESKTVKISKDDILEWKYEGYEGTEPFKEYERKYVNGVKSDETRYNGKNHVFKTVNLYSDDGRIIPNVREDKIANYGAGWYTKSPLIGKTYWVRIESYGRYAIINPDTGQEYSENLLTNHDRDARYIKIRIDEHYFDKDEIFKERGQKVTDGKEIYHTDTLIKGVINDEIKAVTSTYRITGLLKEEKSGEGKYRIFDKDPKTIFKWKESVWKDLGQGKKWIGMTKDMLIVHMGRQPNKINRTVVKSVTSEQWVYSWSYGISSEYYYFENDKLVGWQD